MVIFARRPLIRFAFLALIISAALRIVQSGYAVPVGLLLAGLFSASGVVFAILLLRAFPGHSPD